MDKIINNLKISSGGWDDIPPKVVKSVKHNILLRLIHPITYLCHLTVSTGSVPLELKLAKVVPVFKSGTSNKFTNYRSIGN